ncbi:uncharacterized protein LOC132185818 [Corylus avellana]|uniref:uncharacterized protein LOC132185818 n=1 Tax=Corylus avellana TaxID=13451 RepID=UPI001E21ED2C|nr:uncharacterized protein LOC132185818 [Corylus avellana]
MELQHFIHEHPLIFIEDLVPDPYDSFSTHYCFGCQKQVSGPNYRCKECTWIILHKSCAELPRELRHPLHPKHPLLLIKENQVGKCEGCNKDHLDAYSFIYNCFDCNFYLDTKCASLPLTTEPESHAHPLTLMRRSVSFTCDACGKQGKGMFYSCAVCPFLVHLECTSFPLTVKHIRHPHPLNLITNPLHKSDQPVCELCVESVDTNYMVYYCSTCDYVNHLHCAANKELWGETFVPGCRDESIDSISTYVVLKSILGEPVEIKHFCHDHDLKLIDKKFENCEKCDACIWPISTPIYNCTECKFFLHKSCVELPKRKSHPLHQHPLVLHQQPSGRLHPTFICKACDRFCNGLTYHCDKCNFDLDVQCSFMPDKFNHDGHEHQLILSSASYSDKCSSCDVKRTTFFRCANCDFSLDFKCATLPRTIRYGPYEQLFTLCYKDEDDSDNEYYCDICEEKRDPKHWFYYCAYLSFYAHPDCILGKSSYIKCRRTCQYGMQEHCLTLDDRGEGNHRLCDECGSFCNGLTYTCVRGDLSLHRWCFHKIKALTSWLYTLEEYSSGAYR